MSPGLLLLPGTKYFTSDLTLKFAARALSIMGKQIRLCLEMLSPLAVQVSACVPLTSKILLHFGSGHSRGIGLEGFEGSDFGPGN